MTSRDAHAGGADGAEPAVLRGPDRRALAGIHLAGVRREHRLVAVLHVGHHRQPQGRAVQPPLHGAAHLRHRIAGLARLLVARHDPAGRADVPRQRLGPALCGLHGRRQAGVPRPVAGRQVAARAVRDRRRDHVGRRADRLAGLAGARRSQRPEVQHHEAHRDRRLDLPAGHDGRLRGQVRRPGAPRLGHDRAEPDGHAGQAQGQACGPGRGAAPGAAGQAGARRCTAST